MPFRGSAKGKGGKDAEDEKEQTCCGLCSLQVDAQAEDYVKGLIS